MSTRCNDPIPLSVPEIGGNESAYVADALARGDPCQGEYIPRFEAMVAGYVGVRHAVAVSSGTAALHLALLAAGVGPGDEVLLPALTFAATANAVRYCGATPVFVDVEETHWGMDPGKVGDYLGSHCSLWGTGGPSLSDQGRHVRAMLPVHLLGHPVEMGEITDEASMSSMRVIEDATESLGGSWNGHMLGSMGVAACLSFNGNKILTTGGGGMVLTGNPKTAAQVRYLANQAKDDPVEFVHHEVGYNYRLSNLQAAVGCAQMERLDEFLAAKRRIATRYTEALADMPGLTLPTEAPWARSNWWAYAVRVNEAEFGMSSRALMARLAEAGIASRPLWTPLHILPAFGTPRPGLCPVAERVQQEALSLPCSVGLTADQQERVIGAIRSSCRR